MQLSAPSRQLRQAESERESPDGRRKIKSSDARGQRLARVVARIPVPSSPTEFWSFGTRAKKNVAKLGNMTKLAKLIVGSPEKLLRVGKNREFVGRFASLLRELSEMRSERPAGCPCSTPPNPHSPGASSQSLGEQIEPLAARQAIGAEFDMRADVIAIENCPMFAQSTRGRRIDEAGRINGAHLQRNPIVDFPQSEPIEHPHETVMRITPDQNVHADARPFAQDFTKSFVARGRFAIWSNGWKS